MREGPDTRSDRRGDCSLRLAPTLIPTLILGVLAASPARAYTPAEIEAALAVAAAVDDDVEALATDDFAGRDNGTPESMAAQDYLAAALDDIAAPVSGSAPEGYFQAFLFDEASASGVNVIGRIAGRELPDEVVIVGAHYDHLGSDCVQLDPDDEICNGATDNAAGVAQVLAIGRAFAALPTAPRRSVLLALWDAEEDGLAGSAHYVANPLVPLASTRAYVNFDIQGANLLPSLRNVSFAVGAETGGAVLEQVTSDAIGRHSLDTRLFSLIFGQGRSDHAVFVEGGIPSVFFSDSTGGCYHTTGDEVSVVDFGKLSEQSRIGFRVALELAEGAATPGFVPPPGLAQAATYADALVLDEVLTLGEVDLDLFPPAQQASLLQVQSDVADIVAAGPEAFDSALPLLGAAVTAVDLLTSTECDGYLPEPSSEGLTAAALVALASLGRRRARRAAQSGRHASM